MHGDTLIALSFSLKRKYFSCAKNFSYDNDIQITYYYSKCFVDLDCERLFMNKHFFNLYLYVYKY